MNSWRRKGIWDKTQAFKPREIQSPPQGLHVKERGTSGSAPMMDLGHQDRSPGSTGSPIHGLCHRPRARAALPCRLPQALQPPLAARRPFGSRHHNEPADLSPRPWFQNAPTFGPLSPRRGPPGGRQERVCTTANSTEECGAQAWAGGGSRKSLRTCLALTGSCHSQSAFRIGATPAPGGASPAL